MAVVIGGAQHEIDEASTALLEAARTRVDKARPSVIRWTIAVVAAAMSLIVMAEIDRLIAASPNLQTGESHALSAVIGPLGVTATEAWAGWAQSAVPAQVGGWIVWSVILDAVFVACYASIVYGFVKKRYGSPAAGKQLARRLTIAIVVAEAVEALVLLWLAFGLVFGWPTWPWAEAIAALGKWGVVLVVLVIILRIDDTRRALARGIARGWQALWFHRLSAVPVALLAVLACVPAEGVLDQLPDLQRQWIGSDDAIRYVLFAALAIGVAAIAAFALGRARTRRSVFHEILGVGRIERSAKDVSLWWAIPIAAWLLVAGIAFLSALLLGVDPGQWAGWGAVAFVAVPVLVVGISMWMEWAGYTPPPDPRENDPPRAIYAWLTGDVLAVAVVTVGGLGIVRSMALPVMLGLGGDLSLPGLPGAVLLLIVGVVVALASPLIVGGFVEPAPHPLRLLVERNDPTELRTPPQHVDDPPDPMWRRHQRWQLLIMVVGILALLVLGLWPFFPAAFGPVATTVLVIVLWTMVLGAFAVALQEYEPLVIFRWLRLRATPVLTLGLVIPLIYGAAFSAMSLDGRPHEIRMLSAPSDGETSTIDARLAENDCEWDVDGETIRPVILIAAEGGGIRAAYWTGRAMEELAKVDCLDRAVLFSSGISGGSVGLTLADLKGEGSATDSLTKLSSPETIATAVSGLVIGDAIASALGVKLPSFVAAPDDFTPGDGSNPFGWMWRDRAALIETGWISDVQGLNAPYSTKASPTAGFILLNSTDVDSGCRVIVGSDAALAPLDALTESGDASAEGDVAAEPADAAAEPTDAPGEPADAPAEATPTAEPGESRCDRPASQPAVSWWLGDECKKLIDSATATMLSARFPIVTPGGRLPKAADCDSSAQLVDGGYAEGTGLGTLADLAPQITAILREKNSDAQFRDAPYVPIVVYLRNSGGFDLVKALKDVTAEPLVPLVGYAAKATQLTDAAWLQRLSGALADVCEEGNTTCTNAVKATREKLSGQTVVAAPETRPAVVPPLGWALSTFSIGSLEAALTKEITTPCAAESTQELRPVRLCALLELAGR